jgi:hypothetical protein
VRKREREPTVVRGAPLAWEVLSIMRRYPTALIVPAAGLGLVADALQLVEGPLATIGVSLALAIAFEGYVAYVERLVMATESEPRAIRLFAEIRRALPLVPALLLASLAAIALPLAASGLLVLPGLWLLTRWSLFAPAIARDGLGPVEGLRRSSGLVRGQFAFAFGAATLPLLVEHAVVHATALTAESLAPPPLAFVVAGVAVAGVSPFAALSVSLAFDRLQEARVAGSRRRG